MSNPALNDIINVLRAEFKPLMAGHPDCVFDRPFRSHNNAPYFDIVYWNARFDDCSRFVVYCKSTKLAFSALGVSRNISYSNPELLDIMVTAFREWLSVSHEWGNSH